MSKDYNKLRRIFHNDPEMLRSLDNQEQAELLRSGVTKEYKFAESIKGDKGETPTKEELVSLINPLIPEPIPGEKGTDGRNPMHIGKNPPINPQIGDLWTKI